MSQKIILIESRQEDFEKNFSTKFTKDQKEKILNNIPSKFWNWVGKNLDQVSFEQSFDKLKNQLDYFNKFGSNLEKTDIYQYSNIQDLASALDDYSNKQRRNFKKLHGANIVMDTPSVLVVNPLSYESSCYYGKGTKWCTAAKDAGSSFNQYNTDGKLFYILNKNLPSSDPFYKIALSRKFSGDESFYDAVDKSLTKDQIPNTPEMKIIMEKIISYMNSEYGNQIKVYEDEKRKKLEADRQRRIEIERIRRAKYDEGDERRVEQEWALTNDIDETGKKAWAVLNYLENEGATPRDREQDERLREIDTQIETLNSEYESDPEVRSDLLDQINELEEERDEILEMIDVYYIVPERYGHYGLEKFEVIHPDFQYQTFAVGTEDDVKTAAEEYVDNLIDDIGITGFNESFWKRFLDEDEIVNYFEDVFENDLSENPDVYFDDSDRMLDSKQMDQIKYSKAKIASIKNIIEELENLKDEEEDEDKIEQLDERIEYMEDQIQELEDEIEDIESEPQGDFPQELIDEKLADLLEDVERNPERYMEEYGLNAEDYVDRDKFIEGVIDEDGYGQLSPYDGAYEIFNVMGTSYYVFRID